MKKWKYPLVFFMAGILISKPIEYLFQGQYEAGLLRLKLALICYLLVFIIIKMSNMLIIAAKSWRDLDDKIKALRSQTNEEYKGLLKIAGECPVCCQKARDLLEIRD